MPRKRRLLLVLIVVIGRLRVKIIIKARYVNYSITARCMRAFQPAGMRPDI